MEAAIPGSLWTMIAARSVDLQEDTDLSAFVCLWGAVALLNLSVMTAALNAVSREMNGTLSLKATS